MVHTTKPYKIAMNLKIEEFESVRTRFHRAFKRFWRPLRSDMTALPVGNTLTSRFRKYLIFPGALMSE